MSMEITPAWDNSQRTYEHEGSYFVTPKLPHSEGDLMVVCTDDGQHPSRELARGHWAEVLSGKDSSPGSLVFWGRSFAARGKERFVPQARILDHKQQEVIASKRGDAVDYAPTDFTDLNWEKPGHADSGMTIGKQDFRCPTCKRRTVLTPTKLGLYVFMELLAKDIGNGQRVKLDVSRLKPLPAALTIVA